MRAVLGLNADGAYKILLVPENDTDRYILEQSLAKFSRSLKVEAMIDIARPLAGQVGIQLVAQDAPRHEKASDGSITENGVRDRRQSDR